MFFAAVGMLGNTNGLYLSPVAKEMGWTRTDASWYLTIFILTMAICQPIASRMMAKFDIRLILGVAMTMVCASTGAAAYFNTVMAWNISGVFMGIGQAFIMYLAVPVLLGNWFSKKMGTVLGIALALGTLGSAIANPVAGALITQYGWRSARLIMAIAAWVISMPGILFVIRLKPSDKGIRPYGYEEGATTGAAANATAALTGVSSARALKSAALWLIMLLAGLIVLNASMNTQVPGYATSVGFATTVGAFAMTVLNFANMGGKLFLGWFNDKAGYVTTTIFSLVCGVIGDVIILISKGNLTLFYVGLVFFGIAFSALTVMLPLIVKGIFGQKDFGKIYANVTLVQSLFSASAVIIYGKIFDITQSFKAAWQLNVGGLIIGCILAILAANLGKRLKHE
ncbi:CynX/NimT family MFS transporter [Desulfitobacterium sp.]|uniref:MFS transporter n=1 Tax=Desulfitobacterium sp. TaxID=49981 RepID=UPI002CCA2693|nr:MFS transporter [Desulfitobacterium sp.]HVJ50306.1 MFS transporter [Desulfitobacterium sp.]